MSDQIKKPKLANQSAPDKTVPSANKAHQAAASAAQSTANDIIQARYYSRYSKIKALKEPPAIKPYTVELVELRQPDNYSYYDNIVLGFWVQLAKTAHKETINLTDDQRYWLHRVRLPYARKILYVPQVMLETVKLYATLAVVIDDYLKSEQRTSLAKILHRSEDSLPSYNNILYNLECVAEFTISLHYLNKLSIYNLNFSLDLLQDNLDQAASSLAIEVINANKATISAVTAETTRLLKLNTYGLQASWWDQSGYLRHTQKLSAVEQWLLDNNPPRQHKLLQDETLKLATIQIYLLLNHYLRRHLSIKPGYFRQLDSRLQQLEKLAYHQFLISDDQDKYILRNLWTLVVNYHLYKPANSRFNQAEQNLKKHLKLDLESTLEAFWSTKTNRRLISQWQPAAWRAGLSLTTQYLKAGQISEASKLTLTLLTDWEASPQLTDIQQALMNTWVKYDQEKSLTLAYLCLKQSPDQALDITKLERFVLNTAQRRQLWANLWQKEQPDNQAAQKIINQICQSPLATPNLKSKPVIQSTKIKRTIKIDPRQQQQIAKEHASTSQQLAASLATDEESAKPPIAATTPPPAPAQSG